MSGGGLAVLLLVICRHIWAFELIFKPNISHLRAVCNTRVRSVHASPLMEVIKVPNVPHKYKDHLPAELDCEKAHFFRFLQKRLWTLTGDSDRYIKVGLTTCIFFCAQTFVLPFPFCSNFIDSSRGIWKLPLRSTKTTRTNCRFNTKMT